jgi:hypothetical protein
MWPSVVVASQRSPDTFLPFLAGAGHSRGRSVGVGAKLAEVAPVGNGGQFETLRVHRRPPYGGMRASAALAIRSLVGEFDSEPGFGSLFDVIDRDSGG